MDVESIYQKRFSDVESRNSLWKILVSDFFQKYINDTDVVLDMPCGYGEFINNIQCGEKLALDINTDSKKHLNKDVKFVKASSTATTLMDESIDKIFISNFFEHLTRGDIAKTITEIRRILKPGGRVLVLQPNIRFAAKDYWMFFDHITPIDDRALGEAFEIGGLTLKKSIVRFLPFTTQSSLPSANFLVRIYLRVPLAWRIMGAQSFLVFEK